MKNDEWLTPPEIMAKLGTFDLDPCAPVHRPWDTAAHHITVEDDGLSKEWFGRVWCNPPFGREAIKWLRKLAAHGDGVALIPARTETAMFYECVWEVADAVLFIKGRPHFHYIDGSRAPFNSGAPICLVAYGKRNAEALRKSSLGFVATARTSKGPVASQVEFWVIQDGEGVATTLGPWAHALDEALYYAEQFEKKGPVCVVEVVSKSREVPRPFRAAAEIGRAQPPAMTGRDDAHD